MHFPYDLVILWNGSQHCHSVLNVSWWCHQILMCPGVISLCVSWCHQFMCPDVIGLCVSWCHLVCVDVESDKMLSGSNIKLNTINNLYTWRLALLLAQMILRKFSSENVYELDTPANKMINVVIFLCVMDNRCPLCTRGKHKMCRQGMDD